MSNQNFPGIFNLKSVELFRDNKNDNIFDIKELVNEIHLYESITTTSLSAELLITDTGENIISRLPVLGQEKVIITLGTSEKVYELIYYIFRIDSRIVSEKNQIYIMHLISYEALRNEIVRISERIENSKIEDKLNNFIKINIKSDKKLFYDKTLYNANLVIPNWRIFDFAVWIGKRTVSDKYPDSVGYLFYETFQGYNFKSIDVLIKQEPININKYIYYQANMNSNQPDLYRIESFTSSFVFDVLEKTRMGNFCHTEIQLDFNKRELKTKKRTIQDYYKDTQHLGSTVPYKTETDLKLHNNPSRIVYRPILNKIWDNVKIDKFNEMFYKSVFRYNLLNFNELNITVPGNMDIKAGDVLDVSLPSPTSTQIGVVSDNRLSGKYLIHSIKHSLLYRSELKTYIKLIRDSYG